jgi:[acyl-carrier-protein] S-malonyltransferase
VSQVAYLFPGQGSQYVGMGQALHQAHPEARAVFAQAGEALGMALAQLCFEGPDDVLTDTINAQPAILTASVAALEVVKAQGVYETPAFVAGHSMGEFSALVAAGSLPFLDALHLVRERGRLMKLAGDLSPGGMTAVIGLDVEKLATICEEARQETGGVMQIANDNCPGQTVISGDRASLALAIAKAEAAGARKVVPLAVSIAAHTPLMAVVADEFATAVDAAPIADAVVPVVANVSAEPISRAEDICAELKAQLTSSVRWTESMRYLADQGVARVVEIGPKDVLTGLMKRIERKVERVNLGDAAITQGGTHMRAV